MSPAILPTTEPSSRFSLTGSPLGPVGLASESLGWLRSHGITAGVTPTIAGLLMLGVCLIGFLAANGSHRLFQHFRYLTHNQSHDGNKIDLNAYGLAATCRIPSIGDNLSGITYCAQSKTLYAVTNGPSRVYQLDLDGHCLREIPLVGFHDVEGISYLGGQRFAVIEEQRHIVNVVRIDGQTTVIDRSAVIIALQADMKKQDNKGFEGVAYDASKRCLYVVNEKRPRQLMAIEGLVHQGHPLRIRMEPDLMPGGWYMTDLAGLHFDASTRNLLLVSHESRWVSEVSPEGKRISFLNLEKGSAGLQETVDQPEGITMDEAGNIYIVSEPNRFYRFSRTGDTIRANQALQASVGINATPTAPTRP